LLVEPCAVHHTGPMLRHPAKDTRRRVAAHACPACRRLWALRGARTDSGAWVISCTTCGWSDIRTAGAHRTEGVPTHGAQTAGGPWSHGACVYGSESELVRVLEDYVVAGWACGEVALVIATPEHRAAVRERLTRLGLADRLRDGRLVELDAAATLEAFMVDGSPDPELFDDTVGAVVRDHTADAALRGFGEMVDLLWEEGNAIAALELEALWSGLQDRCGFSVLCGYATDHVDPESRATLAGVHDYLAN
jgi:ribosomal protein L37AE/L43A